MQEESKNTAFQLEQFHQFQFELTRLKQAAKTGNWIFTDDEIADKRANDEPESRVTSNMIFQKFVTLFEEQEATAGKKGGEFGNTLFREALFIMTAIADEVFLTMNWLGKEAWSKFLLETKFFQSNAGGDIFYEKLELLLQKRDPVYVEIAMMYLLAMSLGFRGKYLGVNDAGAIENYKNQIYSFIFQKSPDLNSEFKQLFPETYLHTIEKEAKAVIPGLKKWYTFVAVLVVTIFGISHIIWANMTGDISKIIEQIKILG